MQNPVGYGDDFAGFLLGLTTSLAALGGSSVLDFHHWWYSPIMHLPPWVAFYDMQENTAVQFCHPETAGEPPVSPIYDMQEIQLIFSFYTPSTAGERWQVSVCTKMDSEVTNLRKVAERILDRANGKRCRRHCRAMTSEHIYMKRDSEVSKLNKVAERIPIEPRANTVTNSVVLWQVVYLWIFHRRLRNCIEMQREYAIEPPANAVSDSVGRC